MGETGTRRIELAMAIIGLCALAAAAPAHASSITPITSYTSPRGDMPVRAGQLVRAMYGPFTIPAATSLSQPGQIHNQLTTEPAPCTNCRITDIVPNLVYADGSTANMNNGALLHHFVLFNPSQTALVCGAMEPLFGAGNERSGVHLPSPYGYENNSTNWSMVTHLVNLKSFTQTVYIEVVFRWRPVADTEKARPIWLDIDGCSGDSEYTIPTGYSDTHVDWTSTVDARAIDLYGHLHDVDIIDPNPCPVHCPERGGGLALSAEVRGGPATDYYGPSPPNNTPPADLTGATMCRSEAHYSTAFGNANGFAGHLDTMGHCGIFNELPAGRQAEAYPATAAYSTEGYPIRKGQVIRLHSEYQNGTGAPKTDVMGIMLGYLAFADPYPRPKGAGPMYVSLVPAYTACTAPNRVHAAPLNSGSCNPPTLTSGQLTAGSPDANGAAANFVGAVKLKVINGNASTTADEADVAYSVNVSDVRRKSDLSDYTGQLRADAQLRITDRNNGPGETGTMQDVGFPVTVPCTATVDATIGATCSVATTADAVTAGVVKESRRTVWQLGQVQVFDGGADGVASTTPNTLFAVQGVFAP
jgi:hypothetical protein